MKKFAVGCLTAAAAVAAVITVLALLAARKEPE